MSTTYELVRNQAALFDFSSEGRFFIRGEGAAEAVNAVIASDLEAIPELKALNTVVLDEAGAIQAIVWVLKTEDGVWVLCDPDRRKLLGERLVASAMERTAEVDDRTEATLCLAVIGPAAQKIAMAVAGEDVIGIPYLGFEANEQTDALLCRLGYTGEFEFRFIAARERASELRALLLGAGAEHGLEIGEASDLPLLMLEMRSLSQREYIPEGTSPIQAGLHWMIDFRKENYPGHDAMHAQKANPGCKALMLQLETVTPPVGDQAVRIEQQEVGRCVHLAYSPTLGKTIALAYVDAALAWVGVVFDVAGEDARAVSAPLFITKTVASPQ